MWPFRRRKPSPPTPADHPRLGDIGLTARIEWFRTHPDGTVTRELVDRSQVPPITDQDRERTYRIMIYQKTEVYLTAKSVMDRHADLTMRMRAAYRDRATLGTAPAEALCRQMIAIAPDVLDAVPKIFPVELYPPERRVRAQSLQRIPTHPGYEQLAIIREKEGRFAEAIALCHQARDQGWDGDWDGRIARLERKRGQ